MAEEEAERVEAEEAEADEEGAEDAPPEPVEPDESSPDGQEPEPVALTPEAIDALWKSIGRENERHSREVEKRSGPMFADLVACPCCRADGDEQSVAGYIFPVLPEPMQSLRREGVAMALGGSGPVDYPSDPDTETCENCQGYGQTRTGSKAAGQETRPCPVCLGKGWRQKLALAPVPEVVPVQPLPQVFSTLNAGTNGALDPWGRPAGHPHYGVAPAQVGV